MMRNPPPANHFVTMEKWLTCTPRDFAGGEEFFTRDSGLLCRGFQAIGVPCRVVMPGKSRNDDSPDVIRALPADLESEDWWRSQGAVGVVFYAWGRPEFTPIARAIRRAGVFLVSHQDSSGVISPDTGWADWARLKWWLAARKGWLRIPDFTVGMLRSVAPGWLGYDAGRLAHLREADSIGVVCPDAMRLYRKHLRARGEEEMAAKLQLIPHPVAMSAATAAGKARNKRVVCVGRWGAWWQKRPDLLVKVLDGFLDRISDWTVLIAGPGTHLIDRWHAGLGREKRRRIELAGPLPHDALLELMAGSSVCFCPSNYESFHIAAAEMLCCGGSVVAGDSPLLGSFRWFVEGGCGTLAARHDAESLLRALMHECGEWNRGARDPVKISSQWIPRLRADAVARTILGQPSCHYGHP